MFDNDNTLYRPIHFIIIQLPRFWGQITLKTRTATLWYFHQLSFWGTTNNATVENLLAIVYYHIQCKSPQFDWVWRRFTGKGGTSKGMAIWWLYLFCVFSYTNKQKIQILINSSTGNSNQSQTYTSPVSFLQIGEKGSGHAFHYWLYLKRSQTDLFHSTHTHIWCSTKFVSVDENVMDVAIPVLKLCPLPCCPHFLGHPVVNIQFNMF